MGRFLEISIICHMQFRLSQTRDNRWLADSLFLRPSQPVKCNNSQFLVWDALVGNCGYIIHHLVLDICIDEYSYHVSMQACLIEGISSLLHKVPTREMSLSEWSLTTVKQQFTFFLLNSLNYHCELFLTSPRCNWTLTSPSSVWLVDPSLSVFSWLVMEAP